VRPDRATLVAWLLMLALIAVSGFGAWMLSGENIDGLVTLFDRLADRSLDHPLSTALVFATIFALTTTLTLPTATLLCVCAGYLFGVVTGTLISLVGAMGGAILTFVAVRFMAGERIRDFLLRGRARRLVRVLERDAFFYLVVFRIVPVAPFFAINAAGALIRISPQRYALATAIGLVPITLVYASVGAGLETVIQAGRLRAPALLLEPRVALPLFGVAGVLVAGLIGRRVIRHRRRPPGPDLNSRT